MLLSDIKYSRISPSLGEYITFAGNLWEELSLSGKNSPKKIMFIKVAIFSHVHL